MMLRALEILLKTSAETTSGSAWEPKINADSVRVFVSRAKERDGKGRQIICYIWEQVMRENSLRSN